MSQDTAPISSETGRLWGRLMRLAAIGATPRGGVNRQALTDGEIEAARLVIGWAEEAKLRPSLDPAGNLFLTLAGADPTLPPILAGSHLDTQPTGGKFDGAAGVLAALEAATALAEAGIVPLRDVVVVAWTNEEGSRFAPGMMGSEAFAGVRSLEAIRAVRDRDGVSAGDALDRVLGALGDVPRRPLGFRPGAYVELHIEQGPVLEAAGCVVGDVTGIQGKKTYRVEIAGREGHAGTLSMHERADAVAAFAALADALRREIGDHDPDVKFTIGRVEVTPNAPSVVPARVSFSIDLRHPDNAVLDRLGGRIAQLCRAIATPCEVVLTPLVDAPGNGFDPDLRALVAEAARSRGIPAMPLLSAAGHDARHMAGLCPSAMIFVPCRDGVSHAEHEWAEPDHIVAGANILLDVVQHLACTPVAPGPSAPT